MHWPSNAPAWFCPRPAVPRKSWSAVCRTEKPNVVACPRPADETALPPDREFWGAVLRLRVRRVPERTNHAWRSPFLKWQDLAKRTRSVLKTCFVRASQVLILTIAAQKQNVHQGMETTSTPAGALNVKVPKVIRGFGSKPVKSIYVVCPNESCNSRRRGSRSLKPMST